MCGGAPLHGTNLIASGNVMTVSERSSLLASAIVPEPVRGKPASSDARSNDRRLETASPSTPHNLPAWSRAFLGSIRLSFLNESAAPSGEPCPNNRDRCDSNELHWRIYRAGFWWQPTSGR